jgi:hypothetical protein
MREKKIAKDAIKPGGLLTNEITFGFGDSHRISHAPSNTFATAPINSVVVNDNDPVIVLKILPKYGRSTRIKAKIKLPRRNLRVGSERPRIV